MVKEFDKFYPKKEVEQTPLAYHPISFAQKLHNLFESVVLKFVDKPYKFSRWTEEEDGES